MECLWDKSKEFLNQCCALFTSFVTFLFKISLFSLRCIIDSRMQLRRTKVGLVPLRFGQFGFFSRPAGCMTWQQWLLSTGGRAENFYHPLSFIKWYTTLTVTRTRCYVSRVISHHFYAAGWLSWAKEGQRSIYLNGLVPGTAPLQFYINFYAFSLDTGGIFQRRFVI